MPPENPMPTTLDVPQRTPSTDARPLLCHHCRQPIGEQLDGRTIRLGNVTVWQRVVYRCEACRWVWEWRPGKFIELFS